MHDYFLYMKILAMAKGQTKEYKSYQHCKIDIFLVKYYIMNHWPNHIWSCIWWYSSTNIYSWSISLISTILDRISGWLSFDNSPNKSCMRAVVKLSCLEFSVSFSFFDKDITIFNASFLILVYFAIPAKKFHSNQTQLEEKKFVQKAIVQIKKKT